MCKEEDKTKALKGDLLVNITLRTHPDVLFAFSINHIELITRVENHNEHPIWVEAEISVPEKLSLSPDSPLRKGRVRIGIIEKNQFLEKAVRVYANSFTNPQMYKVDSTVFLFNKDGVIDARLEKSLNIRCEMKKKATI